MIDDPSDVDEDDDIIDPTYQPPSNIRTVIMSEDEPDDDETNDVAGPSNAPSQPPRRKPQFTRKDSGTGRREFNPGNTLWSENYDIGDPLKSPLRYFSLYFTEELLKTFANQTNQCYFRTTEKKLKTFLEEIRKFFGAFIVMANLGYPRISRCWAKATRIDRIADTISRNRFYKIRSNFHINSVAEPQPSNINKFWKDEPLIIAMRDACLMLPREEHCAIDKQMIPFTGRMPARQYVKSKPNLVGLKNFVLCGKSGKMLDFEIYQGAGTGVFEESKHLELGGSAVMHLAQTIAPKKNLQTLF